jgi:hypothetical protein
MQGDVFLRKPITAFFRGFSNAQFKILSQGLTIGYPQSNGDHHSPPEMEIKKRLFDDRITRSIPGEVLDQNIFYLIEINRFIVMDRIVFQG